MTIKSNALTFRRANALDKEAVVNFYHQMIEDLHDVEFDPKWVKGVYPTTEQLKQSIDNQTQWIVVNAADEIMASLLADHNEHADFHDVPWSQELTPQDAWYLHLVGVSPRFQGRGVSVFMFDELFKAAQAEGLQAIRLDVLQNNIPAIKFYQKMGFVKLFEKEMFYEDDGFDDYLIMDRPLV